jgi:hypothetical protein
MYDNAKEKKIVCSIFKKKMLSVEFYRLITVFHLNKCIYYFYQRTFVI